MKRAAMSIGTMAGVVSVFLWIKLHFFNPYIEHISESISIRQTILTLLLPAILAIAASLTKKHTFLFIAFLWSLPISIYSAFTKSVYALFAATCFGYILSYILMYAAYKREKSKYN